MTLLIKQIRSIVFHLRGVIPVPLLIMTMIFAGTNKSIFNLGACIVLLGLSIRFWAAGHIKHHRADRIVNAPTLVTGGPYAYVRNPLYLANCLIALGFCVMSGWWPSYVIAAALVILTYGIFIIPSEEAFLQERFGDDYLKYRAKVPRFLPRFHPYQPARGGFSWRAAVLTELHTILLLAIPMTYFAMRAGYVSSYGLAISGGIYLLWESLSRRVCQ